MTTTEPRLWNSTQLRRQIADKQYQQAQRRAHLADLQAIIDRHDLAIANLQTQLDRGQPACHKNAADAVPVLSAEDTSSKPKTSL